MSMASAPLALATPTSACLTYTSSEAPLLRTPPAGGERESWMGGRGGGGRKRGGGGGGGGGVGKGEGE